MTQVNPVVNHRIHRNLDSDLRYFLIWMGIIGIYPLSASVIKDILTLIVRYAIWIFFVTSNVLMLIFFFNYYPPLDAAKTSSLNYTIEFGSWAVHNVGIHSLIILLVLSKKTWNKLHNSLNEINMRLDQSITVSIKKRSILGILYIVLSVKKQSLLSLFSSKVNSVANFIGGKLFCIFVYEQCWRI